MIESSETSLELVKKIATQALDGEIHLLLACQKLSNETAKVQNLPREITVVFDAIASESDGLPIGDERKYWEPGALLEKDKEIKKYLQEVEPVLRDALEKLIALA